MPRDAPGGGIFYQSCSDKGQTPESWADIPACHCPIQESFHFPHLASSRPSKTELGPGSQIWGPCSTTNELCDCGYVPHPLWSQFLAPHKSELKKHSPGFLLT